jgi:hypothetical protein
MKGFNIADVHEKLYDIVENLKIIVLKMEDMIQYLESTPRSGKGMMFNIDTTEYLIPKKYL